MADKPFNKISLTDGDTGVVDDTSKVKKSGDTMTGELDAPVLKASNYFVSPTIVGEGNDSTYYHRIDFGKAGTNQVDFHEYGGIYNFYRNTGGKKENDELVGSIQPDGFHGNVNGNAASATKLSTARTIQTNLGSTTAGSFDGSANVEPGVKGTLPVANGGTGATDAAGARKNLGLLDATQSTSGLMSAADKKTLDNAKNKLDSLVAALTQEFNNLREYAFVLESYNTANEDLTTISGLSAAFDNLRTHMFVPESA